jgi:cobalt-zinc-cadmium efflux system outer membrane protein
MMKVWNLNGQSGIVRIALLGMVLCSPWADAAEQETTETITLEDAIVQVLERSPQLGAAQYEARAAAARIRQARLATPYTVNIELENIAGSGVFSGLDGMETTLSIARVLELGEKPALRGELAQQESNLLRTKQDAQRLDLLAETARRFVHVVTDQERLKIANEAVALARRTEKAVEQRVRAGKSPVAERRRAGIALARAQLDQEHAKHELEASRLKLSTMWGETRPGFSTSQANLYALKQVNDFNQLASLLERNPDLVRLATEQRVFEARTTLAQARQRPDLELAGGVRYLGVTDDVALVLSASIPLGSSKRATNLIEESQQSSFAKPLAYEQRRLDLYSTLFEIFQELLHAFTAVEVFGEQIIPDAELALLDYEKGFSAGRYSLLELTEAQRVLLNARLESVMAASDYHRNQIEIERLTGAAMHTGATP